MTRDPRHPAGQPRPNVSKAVNAEPANVSSHESATRGTRPTDSTQLMIDIVATEQGLEALQEGWNSLLQSSSADNLFLTWEWISTWWQIYRQSDVLHVLIARLPDGRLVGIAPLRRAKRGVRAVWRYDSIEFIGHGGDVTPEYLDIIAAPGHEATVVNAFADNLCADDTIDAIDLRPSSAASATMTRLEARFRSNGGHVTRLPDSVCPVLSLPDTPEAFLAGRSRNYRKKIGEYERGCRRDLQATFRTSQTQEELCRDMDVLIDLHHRRWDGASLSFQSSEYIEFHRCLSRSLFGGGWIRLFSLESGSATIASLYCFSYGGRYYYYQAGRDPSYTKHRVGLVLMHKAIQEAIREGATVFDFLRGEEPYKFHWATHTVNNVRLVYRKDASTRVAALAESILERVKAAANLVRKRFSQRVTPSPITANE